MSIENIFEPETPVEELRRRDLVPVKGIVDYLERTQIGNPAVNQYKAGVYGGALIAYNCVMVITAAKIIEMVYHAVK